LLHPAEVVIAGDFPSSYQWAEDLRRRLGSPASFRRVTMMKDWTPLT